MSCEVFMVITPGGRVYLKKAGIAKDGEPLPEFAARTYGEFFDQLLPSNPGEAKLTGWIRPRLEIIGHSIQANPVSETPAQARGGSEIVAATGSDYVLAPEELEDLTAAAKKIQETLEPARDPAGNPRAWDIEFGFSGGKLWLFQVRPFIGNEDMQNVPALVALESGSATTAAAPSSSGTR